MQDDFLKQIQTQFERLQKMYDMNAEDLEESDLTESIQSDFDGLTEELWAMSKVKKLHYKKIHPKAVAPKYNFPTDSGFDLYSVEEIIIPPFGRALVPTGLVVQFDEGFELQIRPKSGLAINQGLTVLNSPGTVDQGYTGEIQVIVFNTNDKEVKILEGMKVAQGVLCPVQNGKFVSVEEITEVKNKDRGNNGFGSTGI